MSNVEKPDAVDTVDPITKMYHKVKAYEYNDIQKFCIIVFIISFFANWFMWELSGHSAAEFYSHYSYYTKEGALYQLANQKVERYQTIAKIFMLGSGITFWLYRDK